MACEQEVEKYFHALGIDPLPSYVEAMIPLMCGNMRPENIALFLYRMWAWTRRLTALRRLYSLTDAQVIKLEEIFVASGFGQAFRAELATLTCKGDVPPARRSQICVDEQGSLARIAFFEKAKKALDNIFDGIVFNKSFIDDLEFDLVACGASEEDIFSAANQYPKAPKVLKKTGLEPKN